MNQQQKDQILQVISQPKIYNDSRDQILGNFNKIQAFWGFGKAYFARDQPPLELNETFTPIASVNFKAQNERFKMQQFETQRQRQWLSQLSDQVSQMQKHVALMKSKIDECRRKRIVLDNRVLKVMIMKEIEQRKGLPIQADEEKLRSRMENIISELHAQTKYKACLNELMSQLKQTQNQQLRTANVPLDDSVIEDIRTHLSNELYGIQHLIEIIEKDKENLNNKINPDSTSNSSSRLHH